jgi:hypothetical protein
MALNNGTIISPTFLPCNTNGGFRSTETVALTWHGLPTQVWSPNCSDDWSHTSGGLPDLWDRAPTVKLGI